MRERQREKRRRGRREWRERKARRAKGKERVGGKKERREEGPWYTYTGTYKSTVKNYINYHLFCLHLID